MQTEDVKRTHPLQPQLITHESTLGQGPWEIRCVSRKKRQSSYPEVPCLMGVAYLVSGHSCLPVTRSTRVFNDLHSCKR